jgi:hypothetical protein
MAASAGGRPASTHFIMWTLPVMQKGNTFADALPCMAVMVIIVETSQILSASAITLVRLQYPIRDVKEVSSTKETIIIICFSLYHYNT